MFSVKFGSYKPWGSAPLGFFENPKIFYKKSRFFISKNAWCQPWGPLEAADRYQGRNIWDDPIIEKSQDQDQGQGQDHL